MDKPGFLEKSRLMNKRSRLTVMQLLPRLTTGGVERGTIQIAEALVNNGHRSIILSEGGPLEEELKRTGAELIKWPIGRKNLGAFFYINKLRDLCLSEKIDIVHARSRLPAWIGRLAISKIKKQLRPIWITTVHGPYTVGRYSQVMVTGEKIIAISDFIREYICTNYKGVCENKIITIPRGIDERTHYFKFSADEFWQKNWRREIGPKADLPILTIPARITRWKGHKDFIEILKILRNREIPFHGLIVGGASKNKTKYKKELMGEVKNSNISSSVSFLGERSDLREIMSISNLVFSVTNVPEAFGRTTAEALSLGTPVVGYNHGGTKEIMRDWYPHGLVGVSNILHAANKAQELLERAQPVPEKNPFTMRKMQDSTIRIYEELADKKKNAYQVE